jgi:hypothetical protein
MSSIKSRLGKLEFSSKRTKGPVNVVEEIRQMLEGIDGQTELGYLPDEDLTDVMARRMQNLPGCSLELMPGDTLRAKMMAVDAAASGTLVVSAEARLAAKVYFSLYDGL